MRVRFIWHAGADVSSVRVQFVEFAKSVCAVLAGRGYWADYIDPCSGLPVSPTSRATHTGCRAAAESRRVRLPSTCSPCRQSFEVPSCTLQMIHREYHNVYSEVDALSTLLGYKTSNAGCCKVQKSLAGFPAGPVHSWAQRHGWTKPVVAATCSKLARLKLAGLRACCRCCCIRSGARRCIQPACSRRRRQTRSWRQSSTQQRGAGRSTQSAARAADQRDCLDTQ